MCWWVCWCMYRVGYAGRCWCVFVGVFASVDVRRHVLVCVACVGVCWYMLGCRYRLVCWYVLVCADVCCYGFWCVAVCW